MKISLVIPAYNEESIIANTVESAIGWLDGHFDDYELILVDDGSTDSTADIMARYAGERVRCLGYGKNRGKGYAVKTGVLSAEGEIVFCTDADLAYGLNVAAQAVKMMQDTGADLVIGSRRLAEDGYGEYTPLRFAASKCFGVLVRLLSGMPYDTQCGCKCYRRDAGQKIFSRCTEERFAFDFEVMLIADRLGLQTQQMPVKIINHRESKVRLIHDSLTMFRDIVKLRRSVDRRFHEENGDA